MTCSNQLGNSLSRDIAHFRPCPSFISTFFISLLFTFGYTPCWQKHFNKTYQDIYLHLQDVLLLYQQLVHSLVIQLSSRLLLLPLPTVTIWSSSIINIMIDICILDSLGFETSAATPTGRPIYLDMQATSPTDPRVLDAMLPYMTEIYGNPHSRTHQYGWETETAVENARAVSIGIGIHMKWDG